MTEAEFISEFQRIGSPSKFADIHGIAERNVNSRRKRIEQRTGVKLATVSAPGYETRVPSYNRPDGWTFPRQKDIWVHEGAVVVFSDAHYWPGEPSIAHRALLSVIRAIKPRVVIANGDVMDGASITRHDPFGWSSRPTVRQELDACIERLSEIEQAVPKGCELLWNVGNHCVRFERTLCARIPEFIGLEMTRLGDHFPAWEMQWSTLINGENPHPVMVKHRVAGGIHAAYNNTMKGGLSIATGHTHILEVKPWNDYRGRRYGIQTGTLADHHGPQFEYCENSPSPACSGFVVLTFSEGRMLHPELCEVNDGKAYFRGGVIA